ncbi:MAG: hypothetical protein WBO45_21965, partial [Planctomycetota bacterium]
MNAAANLRCWRGPPLACIIAAVLKPRLLLAAVLPLAACSKPLLVDEAGKYRVVARVAAADAKAVVASHGTDACLVAFDQAATSAVLTATSPAASSRHRLQVTFGAPPLSEEKLDREVRVVDETGAAVAIDLALLWLGGVEPPARLPL